MWLFHNETFLVHNETAVSLWNTIHMLMAFLKNKLCNDFYPTKITRSRQRETTKGNFTKEQMKTGVRMVIEKQMSLRKSSNKVTICYRTRNSRYWFTPDYTFLQIFSLEQGDTVKEYDVTCSKKCYETSRTNLRFKPIKLQLQINLMFLRISLPTEKLVCNDF